MPKIQNVLTAPPAQADTRQKILDAAIACVRKWGVAKTSLNDIAREAGFTRPTVYSYFASRDDVLSAAMMQLAMNFGRRLLVHMKRFDTPAERFVRSVLFAIDELSQEPFSTMVRGGDWSGYVGQQALPDPEGWKLVTTLFGEIFAGVESVKTQDVAEATTRLVMSHLMVSGNKPRSRADQELFIRRCCEGILHAFVDAERGSSS